MFRAAWIEAFTEKNILHAFEKTGIWPYTPEQVLGRIRKPIVPSQPSTPLQDSIKTPKTVCAIRRIHLAYQKDPRTPLKAKILNAHIELAAQVSIHQHIIRNLTEALRLEQKKQQRGKALNLLGEEDVGPQFFSPERIKRAQQFQDEKQALEQAEKDRIAEKKVQAAVKKAYNNALKADQALQAEARCQHNLEVKARKQKEKAEKQAARQALKAQKEAEKVAKMALKQASKVRSKPPIAVQAKKRHVAVEIEGNVTRGVKVGSGRSTRTRAVILPSRFE
jgi:hypothetical protein